MKRSQFLLGALSLCACGADEPVLRDVAIPFEVTVGGEAFACGEPYAGLGASGSTFTPRDLRLFVHALRLVDGEGREQPVEMVEDGRWQTAGVALLDFEGDTPACSDGTPEVNREILGRTEMTDHERLRFRVGVPFELNHSPETSAPSPLNLTTMFWTWQDGYKFVRLEGDVVARGGWIFHLGSSGCDGGLNGGTTMCARPNVVDVDIPFRPGEAVVLDLAALLAGSDFAGASADVGCMSDPVDAECAPLFERLGLRGDSPQEVFRAH
jgi:uncharacterized repeat protein (TIGR04052 family)